MDPATELLPPPSENHTPPPREAVALGPRAAERPSTDAILRAVVAAAGPWFPSVHARRTGAPRPALDEAITELRNAGLVRVAAWQKGAGQGYVATPDGERVAARAEVATPEGFEPVAPTLAGLLDFRPPLLTPVLIGANVLWYVVGVAVALRWEQPLSRALGAPWGSVLERIGAVSAQDLLNGQWWRLVTCMFVHAGFWHVALNMILLGTTGPAAELFWGRWRALLLYLLAGVAAASAAMASRPLAGPGDVPVIVAGASGAVWGLMGAVLAWYVHFRDDLPPDLAADMGRRLLFAFLLNAGVCLLPQVSWEGHAAGGLVGFVGAGLLNAIRFNPRPRQLLAAGLLVLTPTLCVAGLLTAMWFGDDWAPLRHRPAKPVVDPATLTDPLRPASAKAARWAARRVWLVSPEYREKHRAAARAEIDALARRVGAAVEGMAASGEPMPEAMNAATARLRELDRLRELVDGATMPTVEEWQSWGARRREADRFWPPSERP
ncbi:MAG TPA: rhomboid family intramembrane serine protease [Urbifossiella sp.]|nr:rhomboid family intramembrane serine protease [Urbifossiella sp.]